MTIREKQLFRWSAGMFALAASVIALGASPLDDCLWAMRPYDKNGDGVAQAGELINVVKGGDLGDSTHQAPCYGFDVNNSIHTFTDQQTAFLAGQTFTAYCVSNVVVEGEYFHGNAKLSAIMQKLHDPSKKVLSCFFRTRCANVQKNTSWILNAGPFEIGFNYNYIRFYRGGEVIYNSSAEKIAVVKDTWIDLGLVVSNCVVNVEGKNVTTGFVHVVCAYPGQSKSYEVASARCSATIPSATADWYLGTEGLVTGSQTTTYAKSKFFEGDIAQVVFWNRAVTDEEFLEIFKTPQLPGAGAVGFANASSAEFGGTGTTFNLDTDEWRTLPATVAAGGTLTLTTCLSASDFAQARLFNFNTVAGSGTYSVVINGGEAKIVTLDANGASTLFVPRAEWQEGVNTITLTRTDVETEAWMIDNLALVVGTDSIVRSYATDAIISEDVTVPLDTMLVVDVAEGATITWTGLISGAGGVTKKGMGTLILANTVNSYAGGTLVANGTLKSVEQNAATMPFGTGVVRVKQNAGARLDVGTTLANALVFEGTSSRANPGLHFAALTKLTGTVTVSAGDLYFSTAWADDLNKRDTVCVTFAGDVMLDDGYRVAAAPHCLVDFTGKVTASILEGYYVDNSANVPESLCKTRGNLGALRVSNNKSRISKLILDQTRFICGVDDCITATNSTYALQFTGEHLADGWGYMDINGHIMHYLSSLQMPVLTGTSEGCQIIDRTGGGTFRIKGSVGDCYLKFDGKMSLEIVGATTFRARHNTVSGGINTQANVTFADGCTFSNVTGFASSSGRSVNFSGMGDGGLAGLTTMGNSSSFAYTLRANLFTPRQVNLLLCGWNTTSLKPSDELYITGDEVWEVASLQYNLLNEDADATAPIGEYEGVSDGSGTIPELLTGTLRVFSGGTVTPLTYVGGGESFTDPENWQDAEGQPLTAAPDFSLPRYSVKLNGQSLTLPNSEVCLGGLDLTGGGSISGPSGATMSLFGAITSSDALAAGTRVRWDVPVTLIQDVTIALPTNGTFASTVGISGQGALTLDGQAVTGCVDTIAKMSAQVQGGAFEILGTNTFAGNLVCKRGRFLVSGQLGDAFDNSSFLHYGSSDKAPYNYANLVISNLVCNKNFTPSSIGAGTVNLNYYTMINIAADTTNVFNRLVDYSASNIWQLRHNTRMVFNKGYRCGNTQSFAALNGSDTVRVDFNGPVEIGYSKAKKGSFSVSGSGNEFLLVFNDTVKTELYVNFNGNVMAEVNVNDGFDIGTYFQLGSGATKLKLAENCTFTAPQPKVLNSGSAWIEGGEGSVFRATGGCANNASSSYIWAPFKGAVSLEANATNTVWVRGGVSTTTGKMAVTAGTLDVDCDGKGVTWANSVGAEVTGTGVLAFHRADVFNRNTATLTLADNGTVAPDAGTVQHFAAATVNRVNVPNGRYTKASTGLMADRITGGGSIRIGTAGMAIYLR